MATKMKNGHDDSAERDSYKALIESEERYRQTFNTSPDAVNVNRMEDGLYIDINEGFTKLTGYTREEVIGRTSLEINLWDDPADRQKLVQGLREKGYYENLEAIFRMKNGRLGTGLMSARVISINGASHIISITRDISERKQAEKAIQESESKLKSIFIAAPIGIGLVRNRVLLEVNDTLCRMTGYSREELLGRNAGILYPTVEEYEYVGQEKYRQISHKGTGSVETRWCRKDGRVIHIILSSTPLDPDDLLKGVTFTALDITERKQAEEERAKMEEQYRQAQKMEAIGQLAGGIAHDFNNMLNIILGYTQMALMKSGQSGTLNADLLEIMSAARRSADLVRQLLAFARKQTIAPKALDLNITVAGMLNMLRKLIGEDIDLLWAPSENLFPVKLDPAQIDQILANLAVNARDSIPGIGKITIETGNAEFDGSYCAQHPGYIPGHYAMLAVSDNGCGMDKCTLENIFEPFFTTKEIGKGTGMGLPTVYGIVKQNNGFINVYSEPGKGSTFRIYLPRFEGEKTEIDETRRHTEPLTGTETILLVEDDEALLKMSKIMLEELGYTVLTAGTPGDAVDLARGYAGNIQLAVTDVVMPEMSGRDLQKLFSALRPETKYLYMSGYTANVIAHRGILDEGVNFLQKPFTMNDLAYKVREALEKA
jgi:PAS domain S-box-containing protein